VLEQIETLAGSIELRVTGGEGAAWSATLVLGSGEIPAEPTTTLTVSEADLEALEKGELDPLQAFMSGRIQIGGDRESLDAAAGRLDGDGGRLRAGPAAAACSCFFRAGPLHGAESPATYGREASPGR